MAGLVPDVYDLTSITRGKLKEAIEALPDRYFDMTEDELIDEVQPTNRDWELRLSFWTDFNDVMNPNNKRTVIMGEKVQSGIITKRNFYERVVANPGRLAFMIRPIRSYQKEMEIRLIKSTRQLDKLLEMNIEKENGEVDVRKGELLLKAIQNVQDRALGMAVARQESVNINIGQDKPEKAKVPDSKQLDSKIAEYEAKLSGKVTSVEVIDAEESEE